MGQRRGAAPEAGSRPRRGEVPDQAGDRAETDQGRAHGRRGARHRADRRRLRVRWRLPRRRHGDGPDLCGGRAVDDQRLAPRYGASAAQALERTLAQALARAPRGRSSAGLGQDAGDDAAAPGLARGVLARGLQPNPDVALRRRADTAGLARREAHGPATARMVADRMARRRARADEILALHPARGHADRSSRRYRETALAHRTRLRGAQERTRPRPLRRAGLARLPSPRHALHRRLWIPDPRESGLSPLRTPVARTPCPSPSSTTPRRPRSDPSVTSRTRSPPCESD